MTQTHGDWKWNVIILRKKPGTQQDTAERQAALRDVDVDALPAGMWDSQVGEELISPVWLRHLGLPALERMTK